MTLGYSHAKGRQGQASVVLELPGSVGLSSCTSTGRSTIGYGPIAPSAGNKKPRHSFEPGVSVYGLAVTYFRVRNAHYHRRKPVSRFCSGWEGVGPGCCGRQIEEE